MREEKRKKIEYGSIQTNVMGSTFSREECRTGQSHSLFNLRSRRRYSQRLPYF
jgi:hypothetical protein